MSYLAFRNLRQQTLRLALSIGGVALAMMLIVLLNGFLAGIYRQVTAYLDHTPVDFIIAQEGVTNLLGATSLLSAGVDDLARGVPGVEQVVPIIAQFVILDIHDKKVVSHDERIKEIADRVLWLEDGQFKNVVEMAIDPVCGMAVDKDNAPATLAHEGRPYYFCANGCRDEFLAKTEGA